MIQIKRPVGLGSLMFSILLCIVLTGNASCDNKAQVPGGEDEMSTKVSTITVTSSAFKDGDRLPFRYTCDGAGASPALFWSAPPQGKRSFVLILDDPDAPRGTFTHWIVFNISPATLSIPENASVGDFGAGAVSCINDGGNAGYFAPCPPPGKPHRYQFNIYAIDQLLNIGERANRIDIDSAMRGHILARGRLTGIYSR